MAIKMQLIRKVIDFRVGVGKQDELCASAQLILYGRTYRLTRGVAVVVNCNGPRLTLMTLMTYTPF